MPASHLLQKGWDNDLSTQNIESMHKLLCPGYYWDVIFIFSIVKTSTSTYMTELNCFEVDKPVLTNIKKLVLIDSISTGNDKPQSHKRNMSNKIHQYLGAPRRIFEPADASFCWRKLSIILSILSKHFRGNFI